MKWMIPAKTFLLGEYVAIEQHPAILLTTSPCFEVALSETSGLQGIHPESPAGRWWLLHGRPDQGLTWHDPYAGRGGMGASSAQFLGAYYASCHLQKKPILSHELLDAYWQVAWQGQGARPSGYDILAQSSRACVYIDRLGTEQRSYPWPFKDLAFLLLHTGQKLATHHHLQGLTLPDDITLLTTIVQKGKLAFDLVQSNLLVQAVNDYHQQLTEMSLVAKSSMQYIEDLRQHPEILAVKGCGAMGADVLLVLTPINQLESVKTYVLEMGLAILATHQTLYT